MRVLVACEFSGVVRDAFRRRGHDAWSCDLIDSEQPGPHYKLDVLKILELAEGHGHWDLMIAHPPCTYLCSSGLHWNSRVPGRAEKTEDALAFVRELLAAPVRLIALENPIGRINTAIRKPDQTIQPWQFGHAESKATCLWLKGLPKLESTKIMTKEGKYWSNQTPSGQNKLGPSPDRWKLRSITYAGIAAAMAEQWGQL